MEIGDKVRFLNAVGGGKITGFQRGGLVLVEDEDGFEIPVCQAEVVVVPDDDPQAPRSNSHASQKPLDIADVANNILAKSAAKPATASAPVKTASVKSSATSTLASVLASVAPETLASSQSDAAKEPEQESLEARVIRLEMTVKRLTMRLERLEAAKALREKVKADSIANREQSRKQKNEILEVDLHAEELLDTTAGMSPGDIKEYQLKVFRKTMNEHMKEKGRKIVFIHGNGEGVLRRALIDELRRNFKSCEYQDASFQQYGFGATMVTIR